MTDLYALPPEEFVAARNDAVKRARAAGDRRLATEIGALRRPTVGAWVVNLLARQRPELVDELLVLGESLRSAQRELRGDDLRELSMRRRAVVAALSREAIRLAGRANLPAAEIEATLTAALADPAVAEQVRAGQLTRAVTYAGFGETPRPKLRLIHGGEAEPEPGPPDGSPTAKTSTTGKAPAKATEAERRAAEKAAEEAARKAAEAERRAAERAAEAERRAAAAAAAAERRRARAAAHRELLAARTELAEAEAARVLAEKAVTAARRRVEKAAAALDGLATDE
ncbi:hypothetical protein HC031_07020 [Planosporangium thailandense]|uniref:Transposase n=1 Tax=Planosporangium thailandense TaxID=765197 RepID=A0ABX0XUA7_9ACTN|nr:hypothetical protein [Planosporangium thailandense]NJC69472.1 hypothetical protein [Planosporangium thailandense]